MRQLSWAATWAGITAFVWYAFGAVPLHIGVSEQLGLTTAQTSSWIFIVWFSGAVSTIAASLYFRQPIPITWTIPGLVYLGTLAGRFSFAELVAANLLAGLLLVALGVSGIGAKIMKWLPLPIVMGMFGGSILEYVTRMVAATVGDVAVAGTTVGCYLLGRLINSTRLPPVGLAVIGGGMAVAFSGAGSVSLVKWAPPAIVMPGMEFSLAAFIAVSLPMVVMAMGLGNIQGLGFLMAQGYSVPINAVSTIVGLNSVVNALFGGHAATVARTGAAILAGPDAGPVSGRYLGRSHCRCAHRRACVCLDPRRFSIERASQDLCHQPCGSRDLVLAAGCTGKVLRWQDAFRCFGRIHSSRYPVFRSGGKFGILGDHCRCSGICVCGAATAPGVLG